MIQFKSSILPQNHNHFLQKTCQVVTNAFILVKSNSTPAYFIVAPQSQDMCSKIRLECIFIGLLLYFCLVKSQKLISTCDQGDTEWNRHSVGHHLRYWISSIELENNKSPFDYIVKFKYGVKPPKGNQI